MNLARAAGAAVLSCCAAANVVALPAATVAAAPASSASDAGFAPSAVAGVRDAVRRNQAGETPACRTDRADAIVDGRIHLRPGETLCVRLRLDDGRVEAVGLVAGDAAADALVVTARQEGGRTFLTLTNPLPQRLRYRAWMRLPRADAFRYTSSCPVLSDHRIGFEDWPFPIDEFALGDFAQEQDDAAGGSMSHMECR
jgi:hypothetical protein